MDVENKGVSSGQGLLGWGLCDVCGDKFIVRLLGLMLCKVGSRLFGAYVPDAVGCGSRLSLVTTADASAPLGMTISLGDEHCIGG